MLIQCSQSRRHRYVDSVAVCKAKPLETSQEIMLLAHGQGSLRAIMINAVTEIHQSDRLNSDRTSSRTFIAKRTIHSKVICAVVNVVEERLLLPTTTCLIHTHTRARARARTHARTHTHALTNKSARAGTALNDLYLLDPAGPAWSNITNQARGPAPAPRYCHGFAAASNALWLFGGPGDAGELALEIQYLKTAPTAPTAPPTTRTLSARYFHLVFV